MNATITENLHRASWPLQRSTWPLMLASKAAVARSWALSLVIFGLVFKLVWVFWCIVDGAYQLRLWEWTLMPVLGTYQHLLLGLGVFGLYVVLLLPGLVSQTLHYLAMVLIAVIQGTIIFYDMAALRISLLLGTPPTFGLLQAGAEGGVMGSSLIRPENLPYTAGGLLGAALSIWIAIFLSRRWNRWAANKMLFLSFGLIAAWILIGTAAKASARSELHHAQTEPVSFFFLDLLEQRAEGRPPAIDHNPEAFQVDLVFDEPDHEETSTHFNNLADWRQTNRNVILIVLESVPFKAASFAGPVLSGGQERNTTPNMAALRENMLLMDNHYAVHSTSMEDLFSIACSLYPYPLRPVITDINPRIPCRSMPEILSEAGYTAGLYHSGHFSFWHKDRFFSDRGFQVMYDADNMPGRGGAFEYNWGIDERVTTEAIAEFIRDNRDNPFFVQYIPVFPHAPYEVPSPDLEVFSGGERIDDYHNSLRFLDLAVGTIIDTLTEQNLMDDTLIVIVSDHGEAFREHPGNLCHSAFIYEENIHVPFGIHNPLLFHETNKISRVTSHIDILPTIADLLDIPRQSAWQGRSLLEDGPSRLAFFYSASGRQLVGLRDGRYKVIWNRDTRSLELFDLVEDPRERYNLAFMMSERVGIYQQVLTQWRTYQLALIPRFGLQNEGLDQGQRWLADLRPNRHYQPHHYDPAPDHSVAGRDLKIHRISYPRGLGTHPDSWYTYALEGIGAQRLVGRVGRDWRMGAGEAKAYVFLDGALAFASGHLDSHTPAVGFDLDVSDVEEVSFVTWTDEDGGRSDHINWVNLRLILTDDLAYQPGQILQVDELEPSGIGPDGHDIRPIPDLPHGRVRSGTERIEHGLVLPGGTQVHYDLSTLGATSLRGRVFPNGHEGNGAPPELIELLLDDELLWHSFASRITEPVTFDLEIPPGARILTLSASETDEEAPMAIVGDLELVTSTEAFTEARELQAQAEPHTWSLALLPPATPVPDSNQAGWSRTPEGAFLHLDGVELPRSFWLATGSSLRFLLDRLSADRVRGQLGVQGPPGCRARARLSSNGNTLYESRYLSPDSESEYFIVDLEGTEEIVLSAYGTTDCRVIWGNPELLPREVDSGAAGQK